MESSKAEKRVISDDESKVLEPILVRIDSRGCGPNNIHVDKDEFKIGRARENDEIILDTMISRKHCILRCEENENWTIKDLSSTSTFVNDVRLVPGATHKIFVGDVIQFSTCSTFKYRFTLAAKEERDLKKPRMEGQLLDSVLIERKTFAENQECQRKELKDRLQIKQKEQVELKQQLEDLLRRHDDAKDDRQHLKGQIATLKERIAAGNTQEEYLRNKYSQLLQKLESERTEFESRLNEEKRKWQKALDLSKQEKESLEMKMKEQMEKWREQQQAEWKNMMEDRVKEEKSIQAQLLNEKFMLEEKLKETEKALKEQEAKAESLQPANKDAFACAGFSGAECIYLDDLNIDDTTGLHILGTIDLTECSQFNIDVKEGVIDKVSDIMDEQLTCSICSELFVKATTLNCMHTFCYYCIHSWKKKREECPVCRSPITSMNRSLVLDNFIEKMMENLPTQLKDKRVEIVEERKALEKKKRIR